MSDDLVRVKNSVTGHQYNYSRTLAELDPTLTIIDRPTHTPAGNEVPPLHAVEALAPRTPRTRGASATEAADTTEAEKEATES